MRYGESQQIAPQKQVPTETGLPGLLRVFVICISAVVVLFGGYEIIERAWLQDVSPGVIQFLHLLRGLTSAAIASVLAAIILLKQLHEPSAADSIPPSADSWRRKLQHVSLRTKIVVPLVALALLPALVIGTFMIVKARGNLRESTILRAEFDTVSKVKALEEFLDRLQQDLLFLSQIRALSELAAAEASGSGNLRALRESVERELLIFSQGKRAFYQVRFLNRGGREVVRLNLEEGRPVVVPPEELQDKGERYYFKQAMSVPPGQIYVSPMDLNVEGGKLERPYRSVLRYAIGVRDKEGVAQGILVINVYGDFLFSLIEPLTPGSEAWLLDEGGTYLGYAGPSQEKRGLYHLHRTRRLTEDFTTDEAAAILAASEPDWRLETKSAFLFRGSMTIRRGVQPGQWRLMIAYPRAPIDAPVRQLTVFLSVVMGLILVISGLTGILVAHYLVQPVVELRKATREIAEGNLSKRVQITTSDEIEGLGADFNVMSQRLLEAQQRLASWNEELEREVARQTENLHRLQSDMARAEKLASIGQMTASVMHEIGNPLASIKTRIQVAEEIDEIPESCRPLLTEILDEVNRLATFLRSFSRLSRLQESEHVEIDPSELMQGVVTLMAPEIRKRGLSLRLDLSQELPGLLGDMEQLRHLLINLVLNAAEASSDGDEIIIHAEGLEKTVAGTSTEHTIRMEAKDEGEGISESELSKVWSSFYTTRPEGTGLGLPICRRIVEAHGGTIEIRSEPAKGTIVSVEFPAVQTEPGAELEEVVAR